MSYGWPSWRFNPEDPAEQALYLAASLAEWERERSLSGRVRTSGMFRNDGPDIAHPYQYHVPLDWDAIPKFDLFCVKATQGTGYVNPEYVNTFTAMRRRGFRYRGVYHFVTWWHNGVAQARWFLSQLARVGGLQPGEFIQVDVESAPLAGVWRYPTVQIVRDFWNTVQAEVGARQTLYIGALTPLSADPWIKSCPPWRPNYNQTPSTGEVVIRQWGGGSEGDFIPGINGGLTRVDSNQIERRAVLDLITYPSAPPPAPPPAGDDEMPRWLVKPNLDGSQPVDLADGVTRHPITRLAQAGREADAIRTVWLRDGGPQGRMQPPAWAATEVFNVPDPANPNVPIPVTIWKMDPAMMDADAGILPASVAVDAVLAQLATLSTAIAALQARLIDTRDDLSTDTGTIIQQISMLSTALAGLAAAVGKISAPQGGTWSVS